MTIANLAPIPELYVSAEAAAKLGVPVIAFEYVLKKPRSNLMSKPNESGETRLIT